MIKIKITQNTLSRCFTVEHKGKTYYVDFLKSDDPIMGLINRDNWEIYNEEGEELNIYVFKDTSKKEWRQIKKNAMLYYKLISFCTKHFSYYRPKL